MITSEVYCNHLIYLACVCEGGVVKMVSGLELFLLEQPCRLID